MCSTILDPANVSGWKEGGLDMRGAFDPGGKIVRKITGGTFAQKLADPANVLPEDPQDVPNPYQTQKKQAAVAITQAQKPAEEGVLNGKTPLAKRKTMTGMV